jgi:hypothetical protein
MLFKSLTSTVVVLALSAAQVVAHSAISPALGVKATAVRNDVQRPATGQECGKISIASTIDTSTAVTADASGAFQVDVQNFNGGKDGSRQVTIQVDATGTGKSFIAGTVSANGQAVGSPSILCSSDVELHADCDQAPATTGTEQVTASLPAGITCTGGATGNKCLVSFKTAGGFGNCVVVQQGNVTAAGANTGAAATTGVNAGTANTGATAKGNKKAAKGNNRAAVSTAQNYRNLFAINISLGNTQGSISVSAGLAGFNRLYGF